jgi:toxin-antitoxin system PIN domain toxin
MRALLDINVLIALLDSDHSLHRPAADWFAAYADAGWASCAITQNGCLRIMSHPAYPNPLPIAVIADRLRAATGNHVHEFWSDDVSMLDSTRIDPSRIHGPRQLTDVYLLALACKQNGRLVTFDQSVSIGAVKHAKTKNLLTI